MNTTQSTYKFRWWALGCLVLSLLIIGFDMTILNVALPTLSEDLDASTSELQWIIDAYLLVFSAFLLPAGSFGDRYGRKKLLLVGLLLFGVTSIVAGFATNTVALIVARAFMGIGGAIIMPLSFSILPTIFTHEERGKASAIWATGSSVGLLIGPFLGGLLLEHFSWGSVFFINVPIVVAVVTAGFYFIPESKNLNAPRIDWLGMILSCLGFTSLVYGIIEAPQVGWFTGKVLVSVIGGLIVIVLFIVWQKFAREPMVDLKLFRNSSFSWATIALCFIMFVLNGFLFFVTQYLQFTLHNTAYETGVKLIPFMAGMVLGSLFCNRIAARVGTKWILFLGLNILATGFFIFSFIKLEDSYNFVFFCLSFQGLGVGLSMAPAMNAVMGSLPISQVGTGAAVNNTLRQVSGTLGVAILGSVVSSLYKDYLGDSNIEVPEKYYSLITKSIGAATKIFTQLNEPVRATISHNVNSAFVNAMNVALVTSAFVILVGAILTVAFLPSPSKEAKKQNQ